MKRSGSDVTMVATGWMVHKSLVAAERLAKEGISAEVIDPRTLAPLDVDAIVASVKKTGRLVLVDQAPRHASAAITIAGEVAEHGFQYLKAPVRLVTAAETPVPFSESLENYVLPNEDKIVHAVKSVLAKAAVMKSNVELLGSYWTVAGGAVPHTDKDYSPFDFRDRVEACAQAGFKGIGIWHSDLAHTLERRSLKEMKRILDDNGIERLELEFLTDWFLDGERKRQSDIRKKLLLTAAEALNARHIKVGDFYREKYSMPQLIEAFAQLCQDAASCGTRIGFELMPFAMIDSLKDSLTMIEGARASNSGIVLDLWHLVKLRIPYEEVAKFPMEHVVSVELNDGTFEAPWSLHEDTINHRRFCGEGEFDVKGFVESMQQAGYQGPWGIEILSEELRKMPLEQVARRAFATTMEQFRG